MRNLCRTSNIPYPWASSSRMQGSRANHWVSNEIPTFLRNEVVVLDPRIREDDARGVDLVLKCRTSS